MEQRDYDELQRELAAYPDILTESTLQEMEREYHLACAVGCSISEFQEFDGHTPLFFGLLLREVKRLHSIVDQVREELTSFDPDGDDRDFDRENAINTVLTLIDGEIQEGAIDE